MGSTVTNLVATLVVFDLLKIHGLESTTVNDDTLIGKAMKAAEIVPDVIDSIPQDAVQVLYPNGVKVDMGDEFTPTQVNDEPSMKWKIEQNILYTIAMVDPDAPSREEPTNREVLHWLVVNVPGNDVQKGKTIAEYLGSAPPVDTGLHRYVFLIYKQKGRIETNEQFISKTTREGRFKFSIRKFAEKYKLGTPAFGNFFVAQYDHDIPILHM